MEGNGRRGLALLAAAAAFASAGCGGGSGAPSVASVGTTTAGSTTSSGAAGSASPPSSAQEQVSALKFARCMRAHGLHDFPDPAPGGGFEFRVGSGIDPSSPAVQAARAKCQEFMPGGGLAPGTTTHPSAQWLAHMVTVATCMRRHGVPDFPDPATTVPSAFPAGGVISDIEGVILVFPHSIDTQSPAFLRAAAACRFPLHNH